MNSRIAGKTSWYGTLWDLICRVYKGVQKDNCEGYAAQIAFFFLFALFPCLLTLTSLLAYLPVPDLFGMLLKILESFVPENVILLIRENLRTLVSVQQGGLLSIGVLMSLWSSSNAVIAIQVAMNVAYDAKEERPFWKVRLISVLLVICFTFFIIASLLLLFFGPQIGEWVASLAGFGEAFTIAWNILRWPVIIWLMMTGLSALYHFAPAIKLSWFETAPGAIAAAGAWVAVTLLFSYYVNNFGSYDKTYGSIGAVIALLVWMYASAFVILLGGEINVRLRELYSEKEKEIDCKGAEQMRKTLVTPKIQEVVLSEQNWLDIVRIARAELTSEDPAHPLESAFNPARGVGWRAMEPGSQTIQLLFDEPQKIGRVHLVFNEDKELRTQEFVLRWSPDEGRTYREIVRQQFNFSPPETTREVEDYFVDLTEVTTLELIITPDMSGGEVRASLAELRLA